MSSRTILKNAQIILKHMIINIIWNAESRSVFSTFIPKREMVNVVSLRNANNHHQLIMSKMEVFLNFKIKN